MTVTQFDPFGDPFRQLDRLAQQVTQQLAGGARTPLRMPIDVWKAADGYHVELDLPGVDPGSIDVTAERNVLTIRAERRAQRPQGAEWLLNERPAGTFTRQLQIGDGLDTGAVTADYSDGVLHLLVPVAPSAQPRRISVTRGAVSGVGRVGEASQQSFSVEAGDQQGQGAPAERREPVGAH